MLKVKLYGAKGYTCQVPRLKQGFMGLGCEVIEGDDFDFVYCNNFEFDKKDSEHKDSAMSNDGFKIFNVLDIPPHIPDFPIDKLKEQLSQANIVTCISEPVKKQLANIGVDSHVIWNPIKDVFFDETLQKKFSCLYVGRGSDPNKRAFLLRNFVSEVVAVGPDADFSLFCQAGQTGHMQFTTTGGDSSRGQYLGKVNDLCLNQLYNSSRVVALPSKFEGLGLPMLEAMVCGAIPLVCSDNPNSKLCPEFCICEPTIESVTKKYQELLNNFPEYQKIIIEHYSSQIQKKFSKFSVAQNIINLYEKYKAK